VDDGRDERVGTRLRLVHHLHRPRRALHLRALRFRHRLGARCRAVCAVRRGSHRGRRPADDGCDLLRHLQQPDGGNTEYGGGPGPLYFAAGYFERPRLYTINFVVVTFNVILTFAVGLAWWKLLGYY